jgi:hypothetical protein
VKRWAIPAILLLAAVVRLPFWLEALRTPVDGDTAIIGLMAKHPLASATMWGQPYGSPIDAWLAAPFLAVLGRTGTALRIFYFVLGLLLVPLAARLARELDERAAVPAALLMAAPSPYLLLLSALPPPFYSTVLVFCALLLILTIRLGARLEEGHPSALLLAAWGALAGLCVWTHLMSAAVVACAGLYLALRARPVFRLWPAVGGALVTSAPVWWRMLRESDALRIVSVSGRQEGTLDHLRELLPRLHRPLGGLLGTHVPVVPDDSYATVYAPTAFAVLAVIIYVGLLFLGAKASRLRGPVGLLITTAALVIIVFPFPLRANADAIRFLTPAYLPIVAVATWAALHWGGPRQALIAALSLSALHLTVGTQLLAQWRTADRAAHPFFLVDLAPIRTELEARNIRRAYASYGVAYRLTFETNERIIASQPWNERFLHYPLPYLDEVRFAHGVAWILTPDLPGHLPTPRQFEDGMGQIGGTFRRADFGKTAVFHTFVPPFGPTVVPLASAGLAGDGKLETWVTPPVDQPTTWTLSPPRALDGVTLMCGIGGPRLPRGFDLEVSADGVSWERVVRRRRREERKDLRWVNGHPQYVIDDDVIAAALGGRTVSAVRLTPVDADPWAVAEVLLHDAEPAATRREWDEWMNTGLSWTERAGELGARSRRDREDGLYRLLLSSRVSGALAP